MTTTVWYDCMDSERYTHTTVEEAVNELLDVTEPDTWPEVIEVEAIVPVTIPEEERAYLVELVTESVYEHLDEEYGDPDGFVQNEPSPRIRELTVQLVDQVLKDYKVFTCTPDKARSVKVDVPSFVRAHHPDWIANDPGVQARLARIEADKAAWERATSDTLPPTG